MSTSPEEHLENGETRDSDAAVAGAEDGRVLERPAQVDPSADPPFTHTRASGLWATVVVALVVLLVLAVFILENGRHVRVSFFGAHGTLPLGVALLLAAIFGGLVVVLAGTARILQLRRRARLQHRTLRRRSAPASPSQ